MALYLYEASYTAESIAAQIKNPSDRIAAVTASIGVALGMKVLAGGYSFGDHDVVCICEAPDDEAMAAFALVLASGGALRSAKTLPRTANPATKARRHCELINAPHRA